MKYYERRLVLSILWLVGGLLFFLQGILQFQRRYYGLALLPVFVALLFLFDAKTILGPRRRENSN